MSRHRKEKNNKVMDQILDLARVLNSENNWRGSVQRFYWKIAFLLTLLLERTFARSLARLDGKTILNFGCGNNFHTQAVNSDIFGPHRLIMGKRLPDLFWSGTTPLPWLEGHFSGIVCEHVIEHLLPDSTSKLFSNFAFALKSQGTLIVSFPDVRRVLETVDVQGYQLPILSLNSLVYRYGHRFMYDPEIVTELLLQAGFTDVRTTNIQTAPFREFLHPDRMPESAYVIAIK